MNYELSELRTKRNVAKIAFYASIPRFEGHEQERQMISTHHRSP
jgi:hypothetical protein